ncbi:MAG: YicC/YloC family endoribonuclease [Gemmatimonadota bacterium]
MVRSMTGFGRGEASADGLHLTAEVKTVNHRFFTSTMRLPREYAGLEQRLTARVKECVERGHASISFELLSDGRPDAVSALNRDVLQGYLAALHELRDLVKVEGQVDLTQMLSLPGVLERGARPSPAEDQFLAAAGAALDGALQGLVALREQEGARLRADLEARLAEAEAAVERIAILAPERERRERVRLAGKLQELLGGVDVLLEGRILQEAAMLADRVGIDEELTRFRAHLALFRETMDGPAASGRQLTFVLQEMLREVNTMGSKANDSQIAQEVIAVKNELEKLREQVENIE